MRIAQKNEEIEVVEKVLGIDIWARTNKNKDVLIRFSDINGFISGLISQSIEDKEPKKIKVEVECLDYSAEVIDK